MPLPISPRLAATAAPPIPAARAWAARYDGRAGPALDLTQAVPGYPPPPALLARLGEAAGSLAGAGYGPIAGDSALREALAADIAATYGAPVGPAQVAITAGANLGFAMAMAALAGEGEAVLLPTPWYFNHHMALTMQGARPVPLPTGAATGFLPDPEAAEAALARHRARALVVVSPNNPTGAVAPPATLRALAEACRRQGAALVLDETYRDFLAGPPHDLFADPDWGGVLVHLYSFSKAYCLPGHRLGAIAAGPALMGQLEKAFDTWQICPARPAQAALAWAVPALREWRAGNRALMAGRAAGFRDALAACRGWTLDSCGTYFGWLRLPEGAPDAPAAAERLAAEAGLMTLPGPFFGPGQHRHLRLAFANAPAGRLAELPARLVTLA